MLSSSSRSRKQYSITETAPISMRVGAEPHQMAVDPLQLGDQHPDVHCTRSGISRPSSFSTDRQNARLFDWAPR